jgi:hypothetical protein
MHTAFNLAIHEILPLHTWKLSLDEDIFPEPLPPEVTQTARNTLVEARSQFLFPHDVHLCQLCNNALDTLLHKSFLCTFTTRKTARDCLLEEIKSDLPSISQFLSQLDQIAQLQLLLGLTQIEDETQQLQLLHTFALFLSKLT